eukprot:7381677-Prymnesium_polylepis.2
MALGASASFFGVATIFIEMTLVLAPCSPLRKLYRLFKFSTIDLDVAYNTISKTASKPVNSKPVMEDDQTDVEAGSASSEAVPAP